MYLHFLYLKRHWRPGYYQFPNPSHPDGCIISKAGIRQNTSNTIE